MKKTLFLLSALAAALLIHSKTKAQDVTLTVNQAELQMVGKGLGKLPYEEVNQLMGKLQNQVITQQQPKVEPQKPVDNDKPK